MPGPRVLVPLLLAAAAVAAWAALARPARGPAHAALDAFCRGFEPGQAAYPHLGSALRARAWLAAAPGQPDGVDLFTALPDAALSRARTIAPSDLRETARRIRGLGWDPAAAAWRGDGRTVPAAEVRSLLAAALPTATDADAVIDLLAGAPAPGAPDLAALLTADPPRFAGLRIVSFRGDRGRLLVDRGRPPYAAVERGYAGLLASIDAPGVDPGWRVLRLRGVAP